MQRPSWIWAALPPQARRVGCFGDSDLATSLRAIGFEIESGEPRAGEEARPDAVLVSGDEADAARRAARGAAIASAATAAVVVGPDAGPSLRPVSRPARALHLLASPLTAARAEAAAFRLKRALRKDGLEVLSIRTGDRSMPRYGLGPGGWLGRRRMPGGAIVIGSRAGRPRSILDEVSRDAARKAGKALERRTAEVFPSGKLAMELSDAEGKRYFLSVTAKGAGDDARAEAIVCAILAADPPASIADRILKPLATGEVGLARYALEPRASGHHPVWISPGLWRECVEFLAHLYALPARAPDLSLPSAWPDLNAAVEVLSRRASDQDRASLERVRDEIQARVAGVKTGGGHGDFFTKNVLVARGNLHAVLDWEWAASDSLPLLDLFDLRAQLGLRRRRGIRVGENFTDILWPLVRAGGDDPIRLYCEAIEMRSEPRVLEGLAMAHWLLRAARLGSINPRRLEDPGWWRANVSRAIATIEADLQIR